MKRISVLTRENDHCAHSFLNRVRQFESARGHQVITGVWLPSDISAAALSRACPVRTSHTASRRVCVSITARQLANGGHYEILGHLQTSGRLSNGSLRRLLSEEVEALRQLKARGVILEAWSPVRPGAILIVEANSGSDVEGVVNRPPLAVADLIEIELNPLLGM